MCIPLTVIDFSNENLKPGTDKWVSVCQVVRTAFEEHGGFLALYDKINTKLYENTENGFLDYVENNIGLIRTIGKVGSCCLAGVLWNGVLYIVNLGDSRAVIGSVVNKRVSAVQLTRDHNCNDPAIREELISLHPGDPTIVMEQNGWRVKGISMVSRSIGDAYLKRPQFSLLDSFPTYEEVPHPFDRGVLSAEPEMFTRVIEETDKFLIFASDGLWELMTNGIAKRLVTTALVEAIRRRGITYRAMKTATPGKETCVGRRTFHDDICVIVVFLDNKTPLIKKHLLDLSYRGSTDGSQPSAFALSGLTATESHSFTRDLKKSIIKRFKGSTSKGQSSQTEDLRHLYMGWIEVSRVRRLRALGQKAIGTL
ncbi:unnamed protein product [Trifolium pratense]|uniref:Uncharacterized protein n=1 Tax=Trifolium pratense TaxID=57577 RepID=A0ACB0LPU5_TRIPR|nr:unnamed protein product [Trifolium pratense]